MFIATGILSQYTFRWMFLRSWGLPRPACLCSLEGDLPSLFGRNVSHPSLSANLSALFAHLRHDLRDRISVYRFVVCTFLDNEFGELIEILDFFGSFFPARALWH